uniref:Uncharacterized protein n=1 Tax=Asparagus officinalis TaxID=4686 RepID=Q2A9Y9_ASPOF|nr:hypothetical protein 20.t00037 [Asparagus officinalis]
MAPKSKRCVTRRKGPSPSSGIVVTGVAASASGTYLGKSSRLFNDPALMNEVNPSFIRRVQPLSSEPRTCQVKLASPDPMPVFAADKPTELVKRVSDGHHLTLQFKTCSASSSKTRQSYQLDQSSKLALQVLLKLVQSYQLVKSYFQTCHASSPQRQIVRRKSRSSESRRSDRQREANSTRAFEGGISSPP